MKRAIGIAFLAVAWSGATCAIAASDPPAGEKVVPDAPLELRIVAPKTTFALDLGGKTPAAFRKSLQVLSNMQLPAQPAVDLALELKNTSKEEMQVWISGDAVLLGLDLQGPGVVNVLAQRMFTQEYRQPKIIKIGPGEKTTLPLPTLTYGFRGVERRAFWTEPGEFTLQANLRTAINPAPPTAKDARDGFGFVTVTSPAIKLVVEAK